MNISGDLIRVSPDVSIAAYRMVQESLTNIVRHAAASKAEVNISVNGDKLTLVVQDNGQGARSRPNEHSEQLGLLGMHERAELLGGSFHWQQDKGVRVMVTLPLQGVGEH